MTTHARVGYCTWCETDVDDVVLAHIAEGGSGPGWGLYACLPCARSLAKRPDAPYWLREEVAAMEERAAEAEVIVDVSSSPDVLASVRVTPSVE